MATRYHNVTGELTKQLLAVGDGVDITSISATNVDSSTTTVNSVVDLYCLLYTSPSPRDRTRSRMPSSA